MVRSADGFDRPRVDIEGGKSSHDEARSFRRICPGARLTAPPAESHEHPVFGRYWSAWQGAATDPDIRHAGSSGGVLTALADWLVRTGRSRAVSAVAASPQAPQQTTPVRITSRAEAISASGSRYAPVAALTGWDPSPATALIAKPCEVAAARAIVEERGIDSPVMLSFFCAGTPSQRATDGLIRKLLPSTESTAITDLQYRGDGWPGNFRVRINTGESASCSYEESWGKHLGMDLQWRCKLCVDGTGMYADISVGDFWEADEHGFPLFKDGDGNSVIIARTRRGHQLIEQAALDGIITIGTVDLDEVARVQPLQTTRRAVLGGRLLGRLIGLRRPPRYAGFGILRKLLRSPIASARATIGTLTRTIGIR
ncbi:Coenzyme F420 hydrogenase/dehydrogenase, beta subunit C-terminal domain [Microbacterium sp.]|uniref:Coenzyme F420 hydrogenase/dehydrogenase, beta subunit C-terminal domain n=1 Tax=Microbacterium sp. TaxID=51671 RepID=UPI003C740E8B